MTEEEKKAINNLWSSVTDVMFNVLYSQEDSQKDLKIALNLIQKQQKETENKELKKYNQKLIEKLEETRDNLERNGYVGYADEIQEILEIVKGEKQ